MTEVQNMKWEHAANYSPVDRIEYTANNNNVAGVVFNDLLDYTPRRSTTNNQRSKPSAAIQNIRRKAFVRILEQPASKALRFRYECEGRLAGSIPGVNSTTEKKTFPTIEVVGYKGRAIVVVSCVTKDPPYKPHPHNLVGKDGCKKGVCTMEINTDAMKAIFSNLGIQCVKRKDIDNSLRLREEIRVDPFLTGFGHRTQPGNIDLNSVRLCFQVFLENEQGRFTIPLAPVVSDPIYDKKAMADLLICTLCSCTSTVAGGKEIILLCEKVVREDIAVRFFEEKDGQIVWEGYGEFRHCDVHKQTAIKFKTPSYQNLEVDKPVKVFIQLKRPSDGVTSEPVPFEYLPLEADPIMVKRKRIEVGGDPNAYLARHYQSQVRQRYSTSVDEQKVQNLGYNQNYPNSPTVNAMGYANSPLVSPNCQQQQQQQHQQHQYYVNYNNVYQQNQQWRDDYKPQVSPTDPMTMNNFNIDTLLTAAPPTHTHTMHWNVQQHVNVQNHQHQHQQQQPQHSNVTGSAAPPNNLNGSTQNGQSHQRNKDPIGGVLCSESDLLMDLNSAELERLTLA